MDITRTSVIGLTVSITHLILLIAPFHVLARSIGLKFLASSARRRAIRAFSVDDISAWPSGRGVPVSTERGSGEGVVDLMGPPESGAIEGLVASSAGVSSPLVGISWGLLGTIGGGMFVDTVIVK